MPGGAGIIDNLDIEVGASSEGAIKKINELIDALGRLKDAASGSVGDAFKKSLEDIVGNAESKVDSLAKKLKELDANVKPSGSASGNGSSSSAAEPAQKPPTLFPGMDADALSAMDKIDLLRKKIALLKAELNGKIKAGTIDDKQIIDATLRIKQLREQIEKLNQANAPKSLSSIGNGMGKLSKAASKATGPLNAFLAGLKRIAFYRLLRTIIKEITEAFREGLQNAYEFSSGLETQGHRFAAALDSMKAAGGTMKNQLGSAFISLLAIIAPIVNTIIGLVTRLAVALSQLFAAFTGGTYLKAKNVNAQMAKDTAGGAAAAKEWKNQLLGFDEINRLEDQDSGGGGGGGGGLNMDDLFEEAKIDGIFAKIAQKFQELKDSLDFEPLKKSLAEFKQALQELGNVILQGLSWAWDNILVPLSHWVIEKAAPETVNLLTSALRFLRAVLEALAPPFKWLWDNILVPLANWAGDTFIKALQSITDLLNDLTQLLDGNMTFKEFVSQLSLGQKVLLGLVIAFTVVKGAVALFNGALQTVFLVVGGLKVAFAALTSPIGLVILAIGALIVIVAELVKHWDEISAWWNNFVEGIKLGCQRTREEWNALWESIKQTAVNAWNNIKQLANIVVLFGIAVIRSFSTIFSAIGSFFSSIGGWIKEHIIQPIKDFFTGGSADLSAEGESVADGFLQGIKNKFQRVRSWIKTNIFDPFINAFKALFGIHSPSTVMESQGTYIIEGLLQGIKNKIAGIAEWIKTNVLDPIKNAFKGEGDTGILDTEGESLGESIKNGLKNKFADVASWVNTHILTPIKNAFKGEGETGLLDDDGHSLGESLKTGIKDKFSDISSWVSTNILTPIRNAFKGDGETGVLDSEGQSLGESLKSGIMKKFEDVKNWVETNILGPIRNAFSGGGSSGDGDLESDGEETGETYKTGLGKTFSDVKSWINNKITNPIKTALSGGNSGSGLKEEGKNAGEDYKSGIEGPLDDVIQKSEDTGESMDVLSTTTDGAMTALRKAVADAKMDAVNNLDAVISEDGSAESAFVTLSGVASSAMASLAGSVAGSAGSIVGSMMSIVAAANAALTAIARVSSGSKSLSSSFAKGPTIIKASTHAAGGFPEDGLFMANHGELVGKFSNGRTAVANNEQITEGIAKATYAAFVQAYADTNGGGQGGGDHRVSISVNGREFVRAVYDDMMAVGRERGVSLVNNAY